MIDTLKKLFGGRIDLKALTEVQHPRHTPFFLSKLPRTKFDYVGDVGQGTGSSSLMGPVQWIQRSFSQAPLMIKRKAREGFTEIPNHRLLDLLSHPNPFYSGVELFWASIFSWAISGNVYWLIESNEATGRPVRLWWTAPWYITPKHNLDGKGDDGFISHYEYSVQGYKQRIEPEEIVHIRHGINPENPRLGISPIYSVMREVWIDDEASDFVASLLRNSGVPGIVVSPDSDSPAVQGDVDATKQYFKEMFTGDKRGEPVVMGAKTKIQQFGFSPQKLDLSGVRNTVEERVCVNLGIPAAVVGFGTGMEQTKVGATMKELRALAWINGILPLQRMFAGEIKRSLLSKFERDVQSFNITFDTSHIEALQEDRTERFKRANMGVQGGWMTVYDARKMTEQDTDESDKYYLRNIAIMAQTGPPEPLEKQKGNGKTKFPEIITIHGLEAGHGFFAKELSDGSWQIVQSLKFDKESDIHRIESYPEAEPTRIGLRLIQMRERSREKLAEPFRKELEKVFRKLGRRIADAALERLKSKTIETKDETETELLVSQIMDDVDFEDIKAAMVTAYGAHYLSVLKQTFDESDVVLGLATDLPDPVQTRLIQEGGRKAGLIDLNTQTRRKLFDVLAQASEDQIGIPETARRIRSIVPAGPWKDVKTRADVIAKTETRFAQNMSMIEYSKENGVEQAHCFDNRTGFNDPECTARAGRIVPLSQAEQWAMEEHPRGTFDFVPHFNGD